YKNSSSVYGSFLSSVKVIFTPFNKKADSLNLSAKVLKLYFVVEKILASGLEVTFVPLLRLALPILRKVPTGCPPLTKFSSYSIPSQTVFKVNIEESALTTEAPTPCNPPEVLYSPWPNLPPACKTVKITSTVGIPIECIPTGIPRPLSTTVIQSSL